MATSQVRWAAGRREEPEWPVLSDGTLLEFYGQLPLPGDRTVYLFFATDRLDLQERQPLGPGNAAVVQPGHGCQHRTMAQATGPQIMTHLPDSRRSPRQRLRWLPRPEDSLAVLEDFSDPVEWDEPDENTDMYQPDDDRDWNKVGGTARWLQAEEAPPGDGWSFAFQFGADSAGENAVTGWVLRLDPSRRSSRIRMAVPLIHRPRTRKGQPVTKCGGPAATPDTCAVQAEPDHPGRHRLRELQELAFRPM